jgi:hypothetical protein
MNDVLKIRLRPGSALQPVAGSGYGRIRSLRDRNSRVVLHDAGELQNIIWQDKAVSIKGQQIVCMWNDEVCNVRAALFQRRQSGLHDIFKALTDETYVAVEIHSFVWGMRKICVLLALEAYYGHAKQSG